MSTATARRVEALRARAEHPATPEHEAALARELLARLAPPETACSCRFCEIVATNPATAARWQAIQDHPRTQVLVCGAWAMTTN
ncbi:Uncharacterised protein [Mycobacteroides abscessus subsp. abscessus]|uniref:hypothetical protein n=1 Tax=Mycobacteroides abscessus TaxID=36809 RepID=UPI000925B877|nr:hypothetical protein [Mycobacteroides abscessus]SHX66357.1 Uncharacterised protein [Mycobacteroides abscessus subsp. abscessus]SIC60290.1 Uncharacterised protein [Mycobacteroides abscessus subsp. abscessus]SKK21057.1 Uncharacterised protein [Mycobacteroides abscessus subsp. abscessus]SKP50481.1 Uncharacterised protein [Mycobacteroides abscessus subsp. abscessus]